MVGLLGKKPKAMDPAGSAIKDLASTTNTLRNRPQTPAQAAAAMPEVTLPKQGKIDPKSGGLATPKPGAASARASARTDRTTAPASGAGGATLPPSTSVAENMRRLTDSDNPYIRRARQRNERFANRRGLMNTSLAGAAGEAAAIEAALPIAAQDAAQAFQGEESRLGREHTSAENRLQREHVSGEKQLDRRHASDLQRKLFAHQASESRLGRRHSSAMQAAQHRFQAAQAALDRAHAADLAGDDQTFRMELQKADQEFRAGENEKQREHVSGEAALDRDWQTNLETMRQNYGAEQDQLQREFQAGQATQSQAWQSAMQEAQNQYAAGQAALDRAHSAAMAGDAQTHAREMQNAQNAFNAAENAKTRAHQADMQTAVFEQQTAEAQKDRDAAAAALASAQDHASRQAAQAQLHTAAEADKDRIHQKLMQKMGIDAAASEAERNRAAQLRNIVSGRVENAFNMYSADIANLNNNPNMPAEKRAEMEKAAKFRLDERLNLIEQITGADINWSAGVGTVTTPTEDT